MSNPESELRFLAKAYDQYVIELGDERAENAVRLTFPPERAQQIIDAHAAEREPVTDPAAEIIIDFRYGILTCPHCRETNRIVEIDRCVRRNEVHASGDHVRVSLEDEHFEHVRYECDACSCRVFMPLHVEVTSSS